MAQENVEQVLVAFTELFNEFIGVPKNEPYCSCKLFAAAVGASVSLARALATVLDGVDLTFALGKVGMIAMNLGVKQLGNRAAVFAFNPQWTNKTFRAAFLWYKFRQ